MNIIEIILGLVLLALIVRAVFETIWGILLLVFGICCQLLAWTLQGLAIFLRFLGYLRKTTNS